MTIKNLKPGMSTLIKKSDVEYSIDFGNIKKGSDPDLKLSLETESEKLRTSVSCGGCAKATINNNVLQINYNTELLGRILKSVYVFEDEQKTTIKLLGQVSK
jgi:formate dehydrogenase assembly factor FdhD